MPDIPMITEESEAAEEESGHALGLCLSGGGYRAMVFHAGVLWRLNELGILARLDRISSVSGGSITAAVLGLRWNRLHFQGGEAANFEDEVVQPIRSLAGETVDVPAGLKGLFGVGSIAEEVMEAYDEHLFDGATLQDLPESPRFVINATNVQTGALWRFSRPYMGDWKVGRVPNPRVSLARVVAASSAFPPFLSPMELELDPDDFTLDPDAPLAGREAFKERVVLSDGGVYDNMGLETVWKNHETVLVSDAGGRFGLEKQPKGDWPRHAIRVLDLIDNQVRSLRRRQLIDSYKQRAKKGAYWGIGTDITEYDAPATLTVERPRSEELALLKTRLAKMDDTLQERLINWGYAVCDAAVRAYVDEWKDAPAPQGFPYPGRGV